LPNTINNASREAVDMLNQKYGLFPVDNQLLCQDNPQAKRKRKSSSVFTQSCLKTCALFSIFFTATSSASGFWMASAGLNGTSLQAFWYRSGRY